MSKDKLNIPPKINVGFQSRKDTYTGKLAYVVYTDAKGKRRKETSWNRWCHHKNIPPVEFVNEPTSGFVLNKKVGDGRYGWNPRKAWIRIYDPRDFEFEISVNNLVFILEETSAIKGKGLEGEFVYAWDGAELVLLPVGSEEYRKSAAYTALQAQKVTKKDMQEGCMYRTKDNIEVLYLGRHDFYELVKDYYRGAKMKHQKCHVFVTADGSYWCQKGFTKLAEKLCDDADPRFADEYDKFVKSVNHVPPVRLVAKEATFSPNGVNRRTLYEEHAAGVWTAVQIRKHWPYGHNTQTYNINRCNKKAKLLTNQKGLLELSLHEGGYQYNRHQRTIEDIKALKLRHLYLENEQGALLEL